jgi:hypothetical protein
MACWDLSNEVSAAVEPRICGLQSCKSVPTSVSSGGDLPQRPSTTSLPGVRIERLADDREEQQGLPSGYSSLAYRPADILVDR